MQLNKMTLTASVEEDAEPAIFLLKTAFLAVLDNVPLLDRITEDNMPDLELSK